MAWLRSSSMASAAGAMLVAGACALTLANGAARADTIKPDILIALDTSGSMGGCGPCPSVPNSCGAPATRMNAAKCTIQHIVNAYGEVVFGLSRFAMLCYDPMGPSACSYTTKCANAPAIGGVARSATAEQGEMLVPIQEDNQPALLEWVDFDTVCTPCGSSTPQEITVNDDNFGVTPLAGLMANAERYYNGGDPSFPSPIVGDPYNACRPYYVVLLTDGDETCSLGGQPDAVAAINSLHTTVVPGVGTKDVKTFVIGFGVTTGDANVEALANAGGTDAPGAFKAFYAADETTLATAFSDIVAASVLVEICNGVDDDCDGLIDEGFVKYCDVPAGITTASLCANPGDPCDGVDDNCFSGTTDELHNACGGCGPTPAEICNGIDDDCDGFVDEPPACSTCFPQPEVCNGLDDDCDGLIDEDLTRPCGTDIGECTAGVQICTLGVWGMCSGTGATAETCDGLDNDCDGVVDGIAQDCGFAPVGQCLPGTEVCTSGMWGVCTGGVGPSTEGCDGIDNDCDGTVDNGDPGGGAPCDSSCGPGTTVCMGGMIVCVSTMGGMPETCNGLDDDCDGTVDNPPPGGFPGEGAPCDEMGTLCIPGMMMCVAGGLQCVGGVAPEPEVCDCADNDCDVAVDEGVVCPAGASCLGPPYCRCALPCAPGEFPCPGGYLCTNPADPLNGFCAPDPCADVTCMPTPLGEPQVCQTGECVPICTTVTCSAPLVCRPGDGECVTDDCVGFPARCGPDELCIDGACVSDPCADVMCASAEFCRDGTCVASCAGVMCPVGQSCDAGACVADPCGGVMCADGSVCDPTTGTGTCVDDRCDGQICPPNEVCDPLTGACVSDPCLGIACPAGQLCVDRNCVSPPQPDMPDAGPNTFVTPEGGGCTCQLGHGGGGGGGGSGGPGVTAGLLLGLALLALTRRRRRP